MWRKFLLLGLLIPLLSANVEAQQYTTAHLPQSPIHPTREDCRTLSAQFHEIIMDLHEQTRACFNQGLDFGVAYSACSGTSMTVAYKRCQETFINQRCEIQKIRDEEVAQCNASAGGSVDGPHFPVAATIHETRKKFSELVRLTRNPVRYVQTKLITAIKQNVRQRLGLDPGRPIEKTAAQELYGYVDLFAKRGVKRGISNPLVRAIVQAAFKEITDAHRRTLDELYMLSHRIKQFEVETELTNLATQALNQPGSGDTVIIIPSDSVPAYTSDVCGDLYHDIEVADRRGESYVGSQSIDSAMMYYEEHCQ